MRGEKELMDAQPSRSQVWEEYDRWNQAITDVVFPELNYPAPVYLDLEDDLLEALAQQMSVAPGDAESALARAVAATLDHTSTRTIFQSHTSRLWKWTKGGRAKGESPPILAVLAVFSLAAEHMGRGDGLAEGNFYGRLRELLEMPHADDRIDLAYRRIAERYWGELNGWLQGLGGLRGVPTAYSVSHRYVGLPISQALVRRGDRERLIGFFQRFGLAPGTELPPSEMENILDHWMSLVPCPATRNLERLWRSTSARSRIAQAATVALTAWDGRVADSRSEGGPREAGRISLNLELSGFPRKRFKLNVLVYAAQPELEREAMILSGVSATPVTLVPAIQGALSLGQSAQIDAENLLEGLLRIKDDHSPNELVHRPKRLVVFRQDPLSMRWIETEQVLLGDDVMLLAHKALESKLTTVLGTIARPGWSLVAESYPGLPDDWRVFRDVEVFSHPGDSIPQGKMNDLSALIPLTSSQLKVAGGFALPGAVRGKWHSWSPPEIRAISDVPEGFEVRLIDLNSHAADAIEYEMEVSETLLEVWEDDGDGARVVGLSEYELADGDYRVELVRKRSTDPLSTTHVHLRSADTPDLIQWSVANEVSYDLADPLAVIGAGKEIGGVAVRGATVAGSAQKSLQHMPVSQSPWWHDDRAVGSAASLPGVVVARPDPASCMYTGSHREVLDYVPTDSKGKALSAWSTGRCDGCGLVRRYSTSYAKNRREMERAAVAAQAQLRDVSRLERVKESDSRDWNQVLDGVLHVGGGRWSLLERLAMHIEPTALFVDQFARALVSLGHIDVRRDPTTLEPVEWEVTPAALSSTPYGALLTGHWTTAVTAAMTAAVQDSGGTLEQGHQVDGPDAWFYRASDGFELAALAEHAHPDINLADESWSDLAASLPHLGEVIDALPRRAADVDGKIRRFDVSGARWVEAIDLRHPGAYRIAKFSTLDVIRTHEDVEEGLMATSTVQLSKHAAAQMLTGRPLLAYNAATTELSVPLGADLPDLYSRAVVLASGFLPEPHGRLLVYADVPPQLASQIAYLLSH